MGPVLFGGHVTKALNSLQSDEGISSCVPLSLPPELKVVKPYQPIWFIGAGPGDPSLLTLKAAEVLSSAEIVLFDSLVSAEVLQLCNPEAQLVSVGKRGYGKSYKQSDINQMLVDCAFSGSLTVRLKSGDPCIFGRLDEEMEALRLYKLDYTVVPGITSSSAMAASMQESLTRRDRNSSFSVITGHDLKGFAEHDWLKISEPGSVTCIYMGLRVVEHLQSRMIQYGASINLPVIIGQNISRKDEVIVKSSLGELLSDSKTLEGDGPVLIIVGIDMASELSVANSAINGIDRMIRLSL